MQYCPEIPSKKRSMHCRLASTAIISLLFSILQISSERNLSPANDNNYISPLVNAVKNGDLNAVKKILGSGNNSVEVDEPIGESAITPLHLAVKKGNKEMVKVLLRANANPNLQDANGWTALHHLAISPIERQKALLLQLIAAGADPTIRNKDGKFAIQLMGETFLSNVTTMMKAPPLEAMKLSSVGSEVAKLWADTMYEYSIETGQKAIELSLQNLLADGSGRALALAIMMNKPSVLKMLLDLGANVSEPLPQEFFTDVAAKHEGWPLHLAAHLGHVGIIQLLLEQKGNDVNVRDSNGWTPLHHLASRGQSVGIAAAVEMMLDAGADPTIRNDSGQLPVDLAMAASKPDAQIIGMLKKKLE